MRRFNWDEVIWFIVLMFLELIFMFLVKSKIIYDFVDKDSIYYVYIAQIILLTFIIIQFKRIFTIPSAKEGSLKVIPLLFVIIVSIISFLIIPVTKFDENKQLIDWDLETKPTIINKDNFEILNNLNSYNLVYSDKTIQFTGFVYERGKDETLIGREVLHCCQGDKRIIKIRVKGLGDEISNFKWISIIGEVSNDNQGWYINILKYKEVNEPVERFFQE